MFSILAVLDVISELIGSVVYNTIYGSTLFLMKGFIFVVMAAVQLLGLVLIG